MSECGKALGVNFDERVVSERKNRAAACDNNLLKSIFYLVLCLGVFLWASALFSYNNFLFILLLFVFVFCVLLAVNYPSFECTLTNNTCKDTRVGGRAVYVLVFPSSSFLRLEK